MIHARQKHGLRGWVALMATPAGVFARGGRAREWRIVRHGHPEEAAAP